MAAPSRRFRWHRRHIWAESFPAISQEHVIFSAAGIVLTRAHVVALVAIFVVTWINVVGLRWGTVLQNLATWAKFAAMAAFVILGFAIGKGDWHHFSPAPGQSLTLGLSAGQLISAFGVALIAVFWAYDGWVYITWVSGEVKDPRRNVPRAMVLGVVAVGVIYMAMNMTYVYALPLGEIAKHEIIAHAAAVALFSPAAALWLSALIAVSCFGAMASCTMSGARVYFAMAQDGAFFQKMAQVHPKWRTPAFSLIGQGIWGAVLTLSGRYDQLYTYVMFGMVLSYTLTVIGLFILRWKRPELPAPLSLHGISLAACDLCADRRRLDAEHDRHAAHRSFWRRRDRVDRRPGIFVLEAVEQECPARFLIPLRPLRSFFASFAV